MLRVGQFLRRPNSPATARANPRRGHRDTNAGDRPQVRPGMSGFRSGVDAKAVLDMEAEASSRITVSRLIEHPEVLPIVAAWFQSEWPDWYGPGGPGDVERDVSSYANEGSLPVGLVAFIAGEPCGAAV